MIAALVAAAALAVARPLPPPGCDPDAMRHAALARLYPEFGDGPSDLGAWLGQDTPASVRAFRAKIVRLRERASRIHDECSRVAYLEWAAYYEDRAASAQAEFRDHHTARAQAEYERLRQREEAAARAARISPLPPEQGRDR